MPLVSCPRFRHRGGDLPGGGSSPSAPTLALRLPQQKTPRDGDGSGCTHAPVPQPSEWPSWIDCLVVAWCYWFAQHSPSFHQFAAVAIVRPFCSCESVDPAYAHDLAEAGAARSNSTWGQSIAARGKWRDAGVASRRFI
uniref:Uncharacterized protein n=1 Tax=Triticum urartu TaxID=4572 RepID=A0A8R7V947_TRIUA